MGEYGGRAGAARSRLCQPADRPRLSGRQRGSPPGRARSGRSSSRCARPPPSPGRCCAPPRPTAGASARPSATQTADSSSTKASGWASARSRPTRPACARPKRRSCGPVGSGKLAGEPLPRLDLPAKSDGSLRFAGDVRLPRMIFASVRMAPPGGRLTGFSRAGAKRQQGLIDLVVRDQWLAALGETWWAADHALTRAAPRFTGPSAKAISTRSSVRGAGRRRGEAAVRARRL